MCSFSQTAIAIALFEEQTIMTTSYALKEAMGHIQPKADARDFICCIFKFNCKRARWDDFGKTTFPI